ncbi:hypothetical protein NUV25_13870, partial [Burkholderia pseudomultivorans]|uniref:DUF6708 domain-containing protein n=1 Tax=Burkholderia pseudomultivorans TaxID=1207504 RepID=UPI00287637BF|nr:hypothetical protein [Burkholderia pseudomultivorans]
VAALTLQEVPVLGLFISAATVLFLLFAVFCLRAALFSPRDLPVLFNRKDRSVSFIPYVTPSFWRFWEKGGAGAVRTRAWDDVKVRSYKWTQLTGAAARESYFLSLLWGDVDNPRSCAEIVNIGYTGWWEDAMLGGCMSISGATWRRTGRRFRMEKDYVGPVPANCPPSLRRSLQQPAARRAPGSRLPAFDALKRAIARFCFGTV